jgi:BlaI family transcriptional regulator, penicillinase repressor
MARVGRDVTDGELAVLRVLWDRGPATIRQLTDAIYPRGGASRYATVQKMLERLEAKRFVARDRSLFVHMFTASVDRDELIGRRLRAVAESLCGGSLTPLLSHLAKAQPLAESERQALRAIIDAPAAPSAEPTRANAKTRKR